MKLTKRIVSLVAAAAMAATMTAAPSFAATSFKYTYPETIMDVNSTTGSGARYLTTLTQRAASEIPLVLGMNVVAGNMFDGLRDLAGTKVNENPDPYIWNYNYLYPGASWRDVEGSIREGAEPLDQSQYYLHLSNNLANPNGLYQSGGANQVYANERDEYGGIGEAAGLRADVMIGFNSKLVDQIDRVRSWKSGDEFYQEGDENYSPLVIDVQTGSVTSRMYSWEEMAKGLNAYLDQHQELEVRYGDPEAIAINLAEFSAGIPYYIASKIADGTIAKKTAAYVSAIDGTTLTCVDPRSLGNVGADVYAEVNNFKFLKGAFTLDKIMQQGADVIILGANGYGYSGSGSTGTGASTNASKQTLLKDLYSLGISAADMPIVMDANTINVKFGTNGYNYAPTTPMFVPYVQAYAYMDDLAKVNDAINPAAMVEFMVDEFAHVVDSSTQDVALYYIGSNWDAVDDAYDKVPDVSNYKYDKEAIKAAIREGIEYANSGKAAENGNTLVAAYRQTDTAYTMLTENATTARPASGHDYVTLNINGVTKYVDLTELVAGDGGEDPVSGGEYTNTRTSYQAIIDYYNTGKYGYGDDLQTTLQTYADRMYDHVWSPDTTYPNTYGYGLSPAQTKNENSGTLDPFKDVSLSAWYVTAVRYANAQKLMIGTSDTTFDPESELTRAHIVQILYNMEGRPGVGDLTENFSDVSDDDWFAPAVKWASSNGIVKGTSETTFSPTTSSSRETTATLLARYAEYKKCDMTANADLSKYEDASAISDWASASMEWANANSIINGISTTQIAPKGTATRAQMAQILKNFRTNVTIPKAE